MYSGKLKVGLATTAPVISKSLNYKKIEPEFPHQSAHI